MNLLTRILMFIGFGVIVACGNQANDDRIVLSSQSEDPLVVPEGEFKGFKVKKSWLQYAIGAEIDSSSAVVSDLSFSSRFTSFFSGAFITSFSVKVSQGNFNNIRCLSSIEFVDTLSYSLVLQDCGNDLARLGNRNIWISLKGISMDDEKLALMENRRRNGN